ncbi:17245_t:CDS:1, partial [Racocetra persica]
LSVLGIFDKNADCSLKTENQKDQPSRKGKKAWRKNVDITE